MNDRDLEHYATLLADELPDLLARMPRDRAKQCLLKLFEKGILCLEDPRDDPTAIAILDPNGGETLRVMINWVRVQ